MKIYFAKDSSEGRERKIGSTTFRARAGKWVMTHVQLSGKSSREIVVPIGASHYDIPGVSCRVSIIFSVVPDSTETQVIDSLARLKTKYVLHRFSNIKGKSMEVEYLIPANKQQKFSDLLTRITAGSKYVKRTRIGFRIDDEFLICARSSN